MAHCRRAARKDIEAHGTRRRYRGAVGTFCRASGKGAVQTRKSFPLIVIQEAGLDGFLIDRMLRKEGIESQIVDPASVMVLRRQRRAKTDRIDDLTLVRTFLAYKRWEPRVYSMVKVPTPGGGGRIPRYHDGSRSER